MKQEKNPDIILVTGDLGYGVFDDFKKEFPNQYLNVGVAEQNMTSIATGLSLEGKKVFTYSIANFATLRCLEQIRNDAAYHEANLTIVAIGGGFTYGSLGMSHHATEDIAVMRALPNIEVIVPGTNWEATQATKILSSRNGVSYLRLEKDGKNYNLLGRKSFKIGRSNTYRKGEDVTIITSGGILEECMKAADILGQSKITSEVISMHTVKPIDKNAIYKSAKNSKLIVSVEEHNENGGLGSAISEVLSVSNIDFKMKMIAINDIYFPIVGDQDYLRKKISLIQFQ